MYERYWIAIIATITAVIFTMMIHLYQKYAMMLFSVEVLILPVIYFIGYEILMQKQKNRLRRDNRLMHKSMVKMRNYTLELEQKQKIKKG